MSDLEKGLSFLDPITKTLKVDEIDFGERSRIEYTGIEELAKDIKANGLINDICVMGRPGKPYLLLAGGRRLTAIKFLKRTSVRCKVYPTLTDVQVMIVELSENLHRQDLEPVVVIKQRAKIAKLMHKNSLENKEKAPTLFDISKSLGIDKATLSRDLKLSGLIEQYPDAIKNVKSRKDIAKNLQKLEQEEIIREIAKRQKKDDIELATTSKTKDKGKKESHGDVEVDAEDIRKAKHERLQILLKKFYVGDTFEVCEKLVQKEAKVHLVEIDPPYGIDYTKVKRSAENTETYNEIPLSEYPAFLKRTLKYAYDLLPDDGWAICWYAINLSHDLLINTAKEIGFTTTGIPCIWTKPNSTGQNNQPKINHSNVYEVFLVLRKGKAYLNRNGRVNEYRYPNVKSKSHATEKPVELYEDIFDTFVSQGSHILSMFAGSGSPIVAAIKKGYQVLGIDSHEAHKVSYEGLIRKHLQL